MTIAKENPRGNISTPNLLRASDVSAASIESVSTYNLHILVLKAQETHQTMSKS